MYIRKTIKKGKNKTYTNYVLVESVMTPKGPRQKTICSLGNLKPRPRSEWLRLVSQVKDALAGQTRLEGFEDEALAIAEKAKTARAKKAQAPTKPRHTEDQVVSVHTGRVEVENCREAGSVHVGHQFWRRLGVDQILEQIGLSQKARLLTEVMTMNRLVCPSSEHAMPDWIGRTALADILQSDFTTLNDESLYRNLDRLHPHREKIEKCLAQREKTLFNLDGTIYIYDLTSTYFEGQALKNPQAKHGYSRDKRSDCKQVVIGLVIDRDGFPKAHEVFDGNRSDNTTLDDMLDALEARCGRKEGASVVIDRGVATTENTEKIRARGLHYIVASRQTERNEWLEEFESGPWQSAGSWREVIRQPSPTNPYQKKSRVTIREARKGDETLVLCVSEARQKKDRAIREKQEKRFLADLERLRVRTAKGKLTDEKKVHQAIGRIKQRYSRVGRYWSITYSPDKRELCWEENMEKKAAAETLDGSYILKTDRSDLEIEEIWRIYGFLTRAEQAFRSMKSPLAERPIFHQLEHRVQAHIFLCVIAYHLLVSIEKTLHDASMYTSWATLREILRTHQVVTVVLPATNGDILKVRRGSRPEKEHVEIYQKLGVPSQVMPPVRTWTTA